MSIDVVLFACAPLPDGFPGPATDGNAPFWAGVSLHTMRVDRVIADSPEEKAIVDAQGGAATVVHLGGPARVSEFMTEYAEILQLAVGGTLVVNGRPGERIIDTNPEHRSADAIRAGLIGTDLFLLTDEDNEPDRAARAEERGGRFTIIPRAPGVQELPPPHPDITMTLVPLDDDWARRNLYALSLFISGEYGPPTTRATQYRSAIAEFGTHVLEIQSDNSEQTRDAVVEVATAIETAMGGPRHAPITVIDEAGVLVDI